VRVVAEDGHLVAGHGRPGRGAWLCAGSLGCLELALRRNAFGRALRRPVSVDEPEELARTLGLGHDAGEGVRG